jgi:hypothetical protein
MEEILNKTVLYVNAVAGSLSKEEPRTLGIRVLRTGRRRRQGGL